VRALAFLAIPAAIALFCPNTQQLLANRDPAWNPVNGTQARWIGAWRPSLAWTGAIAALLSASLLSLARPSTFLYFQF
jgi:hypothetical protein